MALVQTISFPFEIKAGENSGFNYKPEHIVSSTELFNAKNSNNRYMVYAIYTFDASINNFKIIGKKNVSATYEILDSFQTGGTSEYLYPNNSYIIKGATGSATVTGYTCETNKGPLKSTDLCESTSIDNCLSSYETDASTGTNYRCKLDGQNCDIDNTNEVTKSTNPDIDLYCSNNVQTLSASSSSCDKGKGKLDNSQLTSIVNCNSVTSPNKCSDYYDSSNYRCKMTYDSATNTYICQSNDSNPVSDGCSEKKVFSDGNELKQAVDNVFNDNGSTTITSSDTNYTEQITNYGDINTWDISNVRNTSNLFKDKNINNNNIQAWNTENIKYADSMFENTVFQNNINLNNWNLTNVVKCYEINKNSNNPNSNNCISKVEVLSLSSSSNGIDFGLYMDGTRFEIINEKQINKISFEQSGGNIVVNNTDDSGNNQLISTNFSTIPLSNKGIKNIEKIDNSIFVIMSDDTKYKFYSTETPNTGIQFDSSTNKLKTKSSQSVDYVDTNITITDITKLNLNNLNNCSIPYYGINMNNFI